MALDHVYLFRREDARDEIVDEGEEKRKKKPLGERKKKRQPG